MKPNWPLPELVTKFPGLAEAVSAFRCARATAGHGRFYRERDGVRMSGDVVIAVELHESLHVELRHTWPADVLASDALDQAVLEGLIDGLLQPGCHLFGCRISTLSVEVVADQTTEMAVRLAACMAVL